MALHGHQERCRSLGDIVVTDDIGVPDTGTGPDGVHNVGDTDNSGFIDLSRGLDLRGHAALPIAGPYANTGTATGTSLTTPAMLRNDDSHRRLELLRLRPEDRHRQGDGRTTESAATGSTSLPVSRSCGATRSPTPATWRSHVTVADDQGVTPVYVSGDTNFDGMLDLCETWVFEAPGTSVEGTYTNVGTATGTATDSAGDTRTASASDDLELHRPRAQGRHQQGDGRRRRER